ncbi:GlxA family transcriptional regulator [Acidisoma sp. C75]
MSTAARPRPVIVVLPPRVLLLDLAGPLEVLRLAGTLQSAVTFAVQYVSPLRSVSSSIGLRVEGAGPLPDSVPEDSLIFIPGSASQGLLPWPPPGQNEPAESAIIAWLGRILRPQHLLVTVCEGALLAARAGLLDGYACTTHHARCAALAATAPGARVLQDRLFVEDRNRLSSAGVTAGIDLMLHLVARWCGPATAVAVARSLVVYLRRGPNDPQLSPWLEGRNHLHPAVHRAQDAIAADPARRWSLAELGRIAGASPRNLSRLFMAHAGMTATEAVNRGRVALVETLLDQTDLGMEEIARRAGFGSARHLRRVWRQYERRPPSSLRGRASAEAPR